MVFKDADGQKRKSIVKAGRGPRAENNREMSGIRGPFALKCRLSASPAPPGFFIFYVARSLEPESDIPMVIARTGRSTEWTSERIAALSTLEVRQLRDNAERLNDPDIKARCDAALRERDRIARKEAGARRLASASRRPKSPVGGGAA